MLSCPHYGRRLHAVVSAFDGIVVLEYSAMSLVMYSEYYDTTVAMMSNEMPSIRLSMLARELTELC